MVKPIDMNTQEFEQAKRDLAQKWEIDLHRQKILLSDLTALISENYVAKEEVDKMVEKRLREELIDFLSYCNASNVATFGKYVIDEYFKSRDSHE